MAFMTGDTECVQRWDTNPLLLSSLEMSGRVEHGE